MRRFYLQEQLLRYIFNYDEKRKVLLACYVHPTSIIWANDDFVQAG